LVGGGVRDALLGVVSHDFDLAVPAQAISLARRAADALGGDFYVLDESFDAARVIVTDASGFRDVLDFASFRGHDISADLEGRDFTINAMALNLKTRTTLDPLHGAADLRAKLIRACSAAAMQDDPIRILRAVRLAAALDFRIEQSTREAMKAAADLLPTTSAERQRDELFRILGGHRPDAGVRALEVLGVLRLLLPELTQLKGVEQPAPHVHDAWGHTLSVMRHLAQILDLLLEGKVDDANGIHAGLLTLGVGRYREHFGQHFLKSLNHDRTLRALLEFAALYHDVGKTSARSVDADGQIHSFGHEHHGAEIAVRRAKEFNLSNSEVARLEAIIENHLRFFFMASRMEAEGEPPSRRAIYRFFRDAGDSGVDLILLGLADLRGTRDHVLTERSWSTWVDVARVLLENLWEKPEEAVAPPRLIDGNELMRAHALRPGPIVGMLLEAIREAQAMGEVATRDEALQFGRAWLKTNSAQSPRQNAGSGSHRRDG
ncbi:MAG: HD domain-containing protein, partial [Chloroflexota bacterium]